jgi:hypothetical protein
MPDYTKVQATDGLGNVSFAVQMSEDEFNAYERWKAKSEVRWKPLDTAAQNIRIEALRAASRVVVSLPNPELNEDMKHNWAAEITRELAEQFARWIEKGK